MSLQDRIESLKVKHAALETAIAAENRHPSPNASRISLMKRKKLAIKDELTRINSPTH